MLKNMLDNFFYLQYLEACQSKKKKQQKKQWHLSVNLSIWSLRSFKKVSSSEWPQRSRYSQSSDIWGKRLIQSNITLSRLLCLTIPQAFRPILVWPEELNQSRNKESCQRLLSHPNNAALNAMLRLFWQGFRNVTDISRDSMQMLQGLWPSWIWPWDEWKRQKLLKDKRR